jgi:hypothetical protein
LASFDDVVLIALLTLKANLIHQFRIEHQELAHIYRPGFRVRLGIVYGEFDFEATEIRSTNPLDHLGRFRQRVAAAIEPQIIPESDRLDY